MALRVSRMEIQWSKLTDANTRWSDLPFGSDMLKTSWIPDSLSSSTLRSADFLHSPAVPSSVAWAGPPLWKPT